MNCGLFVAFLFRNADSDAMSSREMVIDLVNKIELLAGLEKARWQARRGEGIPAEAARKLMDAWAAR